MARVTSKDVARAAGVSQTTVSFVLNGRNASISTRTRELVLETARRLGYIPSAAGRALAAGRSDVIACIAPAAEASEAVENLKHALSAAFEDAGYTCVFLYRGGSSRPLADVWQHVDPAAVIALDALSPEDLDDLRNTGVPCWTGLVMNGQSSSHSFDQSRIGELQIRHLAGQGHRDIGYLTRADAQHRGLAAARRSGAERACVELGLPDLRILHLPADPADASEAVHQWVASGVTGIAAFNDIAAISLLAACLAAAVPVPSRLAVIGVDDVEVASVTTPPLTSIAMDFSAFAFRVAADLVTMIDGGTPSEHTGDDTLRVVSRATT